MTTNTNNQPNKFTRFLRNHAALLLLIFSLLAVGAVVLVVMLGGNNGTIDDNPLVVKPDDPSGGITPDKPTPADPIYSKVYFASPVEYTGVGMEYSDGKEVVFVFNKTLNSWSTHKGIDLIADDGTQVTAMYAGTVIDVSESYGMGNIVKIDHGDNVVCTYASLSDVKVVKGQNVEKGDVLGSVSSSASYEFDDGAHLHLEIAVKDEYVDPMPYVKCEVFREVEQK